MDKFQSSTSLLANLLAFEAAARLGSFTRAADELAVSQPAVSLRVRQLERRLGASLFAREGRGVALTADGLRLWQGVKAGLGRIHEAVEAVERRQANHDTVTVVVSSAFASYWLLPRMRNFQERHPSIELRVLTSDRPVDLIAERIPLAIRHGDGAFPDHEAWPLAREAIFPVCAPRYLEMREPIRSVDDLAHHRLIELHERHRRHLTWEDWFREAGVHGRRAAKRLDFSDYALVLKAALAGDGIALGWEHLVGDLLAERHLVAPVPNTVVTGSAYWLIAPRGWRATAATTCFREWLLAESRSSERDRAT
ncbi:LysR substrate-binding domain-containing protein [Rhodospirillaceae bacterium SYSU D60014]|uniref:LysR substrate-binding domain-containing protein n=1 Tax=Virgifigura deserti TaxID=2268457 RepID=UPI000E665FFE